jgi:hypothetical protein
MASAAAASLALRALVDELSALEPTQMERIEAARGSLGGGGVEHARLDALEALATAGRAGMLEAASEDLALASVHREIPRAVRSAAYDAALALLASDLVPPQTFRALYGPWDEGTHEGAGSEALEHGEEVLIHLD